MSDFEARELSAAETGWVRELASDAGVGDGVSFAIAVHLPGNTVDQAGTPVFDLFLDPLPDRDTIVRHRPTPGG